MSLSLVIGSLPCADFPASLADRVAQHIATLWSVEPGEICTSWSPATMRSPLTDEVPFRLVGSGADGWFTVAFEPEGVRPTVARVRAGLEDSVEIASRPLPTGHRLEAEDVRRETAVRWGPPTQEERERPQAGWETRRPLTAGEVLAWPAVAPPALIQAGQPIQMVWSRGEVNIAVSAVALHAARRGEKIRARIDGSRARLTGIVSAPGRAVLTGGSHE